jgi:hypothetical protein
VAANRPDWVVQAAFNADPNDPNVISLWSDLTALVLGASAIARGRQYELAQTMAAQPQVAFRDPNEYLNPANTGSPYSPYVLPYRQILWQGVWNPNTNTNTAAGNLLNSATWRVPYDGSFDSYTAGAAVAWVTAVGATTPVVGTTTPHSGANDLTWAVAGTSTAQGVSWQVPCIPGRQYTSSAYVRQSTGSTQQISVGDQTAGVDVFGTTVANGWGTADYGGTWTAAGGSASDFSVVGGSGGTAGVAYHTATTVNVARTTTVGTGFYDSDTVVAITVPAVATGSYISMGVIGRYVDASNSYRAVARFNTDQTITIAVTKRVAGTDTDLATATSTLTYTAGAQFQLRFTVSGSSLSAKLWPILKGEPSAYDVTIADTSITSTGGVGCYTRLNTGNTNTNPALGFATYYCAAYLAGSTTTTTGSYVRLSVTFTATQPYQTVQVATTGTATAGTVLLDDVQHEQAASASTFTTTGAVIYPVMRNYIERWPRVYQAQGFEGFSVAPGVDGFAALNALALRTEYESAVLALGPDFYWPLHDGQDVNAFAETSGNHQPPLLPVVSKYGAGAGLQAAVTLEVAGDPGGSGVQTTPDPDAPTGFQQKVTLLGTGLLFGTPRVAVPALIGNSWAVTAAAWVVGNQVDPATAVSLFLPYSVAADLSVWYPISLELDGVGGGPSAGYVNTFLNQLSADGTTNFRDGQLHHIVGTVTQVNGGNTVISVYGDGALQATATATTASLGGMLGRQADTILLGGIIQGSAIGDIHDGLTSHVALWNRALSSAEISALYSAGATAFAGETSGTRITRHLALGGYTGATRISTGQSTMQAPSWQTAIDLLSDCQDTNTAEGGTIWMAPDGAFVFEDRNTRFLRLTSTYTFGEDTAGGEIPYLGEPGDLEFDFDPNFVYADVEITRNNGTVAIGGTAADILTAARRYFPRSYTSSVDLQTDTETQDQADWVFNTHKAPLERVSQVTIDPASNIGLWSVALSVEVGMRITLKRRPKAANQGAGITISGDFFIEAVTHDQINMETGTWRTTLLLSPIGRGPGVTVQPWILDNATYSVLDSTTVLGW